MRIICFTIIWLLGLITQVNAQTKAQIISDVRSTMEDFMADLSLVNEDKENSQQLLLDIADTYGSSEYFMRDNRQMNSFLSWLDSYCNIQLNGQVVQHTLTIQEQSLKKVDNKDKNDQRWTFEGKLHRSIFHSDKTMALPEKLLKLTVVWNGTKRYVKILSIDGEIPLIPFGADNIDDKLQQATAFLESETPDLAVHILAPMMANNERAKEMMQKAVEWYRTMAEEGNIHAMNALGLCYQFGAVVPQNTDTAKEYYLKAAMGGHPAAQNTIGSFYGIEKDYEKALQWYYKAAEVGDANALCNIGIYHLFGYGIEKDEKTAVEWFMKAAVKGQAVARYNLAYCYLSGLGVTQNFKAAEQWFLKAAEQGMSLAEYMVGYNYLTGEYFKKNIKKAVYWLTKAAEKNQPNAQTALGKMHMEGEGVKVDYAKAKTLLEKAVKQGDAFAYYHLGCIYSAGLSVQQDDEKAVSLWKIAAEHGVAQAQHDLGVSYFRGAGIEKNEQKAFEWFYKSAQQNWPDGVYNLARCYEFGRGTTKDIEKALEYYLKAQELGYVNLEDTIAGCKIELNRQQTK